MFWAITPSNSLKVNRCFGVTYRLHLQGRIISCLINQGESRWQGSDVSPKRRLTCNGVQRVISQNTVLFTTAAVRTPNPTRIRAYKLCNVQPVTRRADMTKFMNTFGNYEFFTAKKLINRCVYSRAIKIPVIKTVCQDTNVFKTVSGLVLNYYVGFRSPKILSNSWMHVVLTEDEQWTFGTEI
jgi:hypothetical protein